jgi:ElaB/YqjD/DUF883 family membrane-anchored ribosome-binding protein
MNQVTDRITAANEQLVAGVKDAAYITIGFGVIAAQQAQTRLTELRSCSSKGTFEMPTMDDVRSLADRLPFDLDVDATVDAGKKVAADIEARVEELLDQVETALPEQVRPYAQQARGIAADAREQVQALIARVA